ncbi:MAG: pyruvate, phosphate dikinase [Spirochaetota bacterium]
MATQHVYFFGGKKDTEGSAEMKELLGGKGANLAEMSKIGVPVPPGFTISTEVCRQFYENNRQYPKGLKEQVEAAVERLEKKMGKKLGDPNDPLLVSVRSGAAVSMPGMMDTVLNLGMNDNAVTGLASASGNERFAWDAYRRFINMFGNVVKGIDHEHFEEAMDEVKKKKGVEEDVDLDADDLKEVVKRYKAVFRKNAKMDFPQEPIEQLWAAIDAVFGSWNNPRAISYRKINNMKGLIGTAVNVQSMVFGNLGDDSGTGVCFSRDPSTGENVFYGEYLMNAQGEDVVAGIRTPKPLKTLSKQNPTVYKQLVEVKERLEAQYGDMQDMEFTIERGTLYILQTRNGKRTGVAAVKIVVDLVAENKIKKEDAVRRVTPELLDQVFHPMIDPRAKKGVKALARGLNASPGAACGQIVFTAEDAEARKADGKKVVLVRRETSPEDIGGMYASEGILTSTGGMTSHAAVVGRGMGLPCVVGCKSARISGKTLTIGDKKFKEGDYLTLDGTSGDVFEGQLNLVQPKVKGELNTFLSWCDEIRLSGTRSNVDQKGILVRANADKPTDAKRARDFGAEGIGLCRTEHMFFEERLPLFQEMIVAEDESARRKALKKLLPYQKRDFKGIFKAMAGYPVTIRLLDPPLHEFVPHEAKDIKRLSEQTGISAKNLKQKIESLQELNPMLGHRGCRLAITYPEIYEMQVEAIITAACESQKAGVKVFPEIMIPLVGSVGELKPLRAMVERVASDVIAKKKVKLKYSIGTMIEVPRAALIADKIAEEADFFSFGTNDLTQMGMGFSRDDVGSFIPQYVEEGIYDNDPFQVLDQEGIGQLVEIGTSKGRKTKPDLKVGICGEHGGEPASVEFCYRTGLNYVSCSPFRVPIARLAAAHSVLKNR